MILRVYIQCGRHRKTRAVPRKFTKYYIQQPGMYVQQSHSSKSVKGCRCAVSNKHTADDNGIDPDSSFSRFSN